MTEPLEEKPQGTAETSQPHEPEQPREKRSRPGLIAGAAGMTALVVLFALLFAAFNNRSTAAGGAPLPTAPAGWQRYSDPGGHFTVLIPKGWTVHSESGTGTEGSSRGSVTFHDTMNAFGGPPNSQKTITVWIYPRDAQRVVQSAEGASSARSMRSPVSGKEQPPVLSTASLIL